MKELREVLRWIWLLTFLHGCTTSPTSTDHPRHHRHERSRLRRQHGGADPDVFYLLPSDPDLPPDQSPAESGDWGPWTAPSECSRSCGGGVQFQTRECSPYSSCLGSKTRYYSCNIQDCLEGSDFRAEQCAAYNHIEYEGKTYDWIPYRHAENQCALNCMPKGERYYYRHKDAVHDGTPCNEDSLDVCVQGKCLPVGCDKLLGSTAKEDSCRVCGGDGSTCTKKSGVIETNAQPGYVDLFLIPANATNIRIQERRASNNYLAIRNQDNHFYLNGGWTISNSGVIKFAGTKFHYSRKPFPNYAPEVLYALGPTSEPLYIALLYQEHNPGIEYVYSVPVGSIRESPKQGYTWRTDPFSECNVTCGGGIQTRKVWCAHGSEQVGNILCDPSTEPASSKLCGEQPCPAEWVVEKWSPCSAPCGELGYQTRQVNCLQAVGFSTRSVTEHLCKGEKPESSIQCQEKGPCPVWHVGPWKPCDRLCGEGKQKRDVLCYKKVDGLVEILPDSQCLEDKPETEQICLLMPCEGLDWITSEWSGCSDKCGQAIETRIVKCADEKGHPYNESMCHSYRKPESVRNCTYVPCSSQWFTSQWNECSAKCGQGIQTRSIICASLDGNKLTLMDNSKCEEKLKPEGTMECRAEQECKGEWFVSPFGECSKPCGGGTQERNVLCLRDNMTVKSDECDMEHFIVGNSKECNTQPCGEDELIPVSTAQVITEEESEECDYDDYSDYDEDSTDSDGLIKADGLSAVSESGVTDEIEGSGGYSDELIFISSTSGPEGSSLSGVSSSDSESSDSSTEGVSDKTSSGGLTEGVSEGPSSLAGSSFDASTGTLADQAVTGGSTDGLSVAASDPGVTGASTEKSSDSPAGTDVTEIAGASDGASSELPGASTELAGASSVVPGASSEIPGASSEIPGASSEIPGASTESPIGSSESSDVSESPAGGSSPSGTDASAPADGSTPSGTDTSASVDVVSAGAVTGSSDSAESSATDTTESPVTDSSSVDASSGTGSDSTATESVGVSVSASAGGTSDTTPAAGVSDSSSATGVTDSAGVTGISVSSAALVSEGSTALGSDSSDSTGASSLAGSSSSNDASAGTTLASATDISGSDSSSVNGISTTESSSSSEPSLTSSSETAGSSIAGLTTEGGVSGSMSASSSASASDSSTTEVTDSSTSAGGSSTEMASESSASSSSLTGSTESTGISSSESTGISSSESTGISSSESSFSPESTDLTEAVFGFTTESDVDKAIKREKKMRKCKRRKGKKKCVTSPFGCCPDGKTEAKGPFSKGCPMPKTCKESKYGCCPDELSAAKGPDSKGCPKSLCDQTLFGCCPDKVTPSMGNSFEGCPIQTTPLPDCNLTTYGCCPDGKIAEGPYFQGCIETCSKTEFGCCPDGFTVKTGLDYEGCDIPSNETCSSSEFGCCPDGLNVAEGSDDEGCQNCTEWRFGCCPDGILAARGLRQFGCAPACSTSDFGCCSDNKTFAHGPNQEGCCLNTAFGCCPDNVVPAQGPNYYGCDCRSSAYGCCPDGKTSATGPENLGCGCQYSEFGCCPDRQTAADGPNFEGCACHTYQFGCCPDGVTIVKGPNLEGCGCEHSSHGCCPDGKTRKEGPDRNCTCEATKFGCCPDGINEAKGDDFEGCENVPITGEVCTLPRANGECREFKIVYWFDNTYGGCARFWYGGCGGNQNRFKSLDECKSVCVSPIGKDVCTLPVSKGSCRHDFPMWYYDKAYKQCRPFSWTGCLGNSNRFHTREECELQCGSQEHLDPCEQTLEHGPCNGTYERWYYNKEDRDCIPFTYGGCKGTKNNFLSQAACKAKCMKPDQQRPECSLPKAAGTCTEKFSKWHFEPKERRCMPFYYSGCGGNGNHFDSLEDCNGYCPVKKERDICVLPSDVGSCSTYMLRWYFDTLESRCKQFYWGGCAGNGNNFLTERDCLRRCDKLPEPETTFREEMCSLPPEKGRCSESIRQWRYDSADGTCKVFDYSGCEGNGNRFETEELCLQSCSQSQDPCSLPKVQGPCDKFELKWHFDQGSSSCRQFYYGGCHGNANRFQNAEECRAKCQPDDRGRDLEYEQPHPEPEQPQPEPEQPQPEPEQPQPEPEQPQPEPEQPQPEPEQPQPEPEQPQPEQERPRPPVPDESDICYLRSDPGPCYETIEAWYYDPSNERCTQLVYGGCQGNANRFISEEQCERQCGIFKNQEVCADDVEEGTCNSPDSSPVEKYYFDRLENVCRRFSYSGCGGNINRFSTLEECRTVCLNFTEPKIPLGTDQETTNRGICGLPMESGPCESITKRYFYDDKRRTCVSFVYSGCGGNLNNFLSLEDCMNTCVVPSGAPAPEPEQPDPNSIDVGAGPVKDDCPSKEECARLRCPYGIEKWVDNEGCEQCRCHDPCAACTGPCEVRLVPETSGDVYRGYCEGEEPPRPAAPSAKAGQCPEVQSPDLDLDCSSNCNYDYDCSGTSKCCYNGCATVCTPVRREQTPIEEPLETPPYIDDDTEQRVEGEEGNLIGLHCIARGTPTPTVSWKRNGEMLSPISGSKYRISQNGTLEIILLKREDQGTYICEASNGVEPSATRDYELIVKAGKPLTVAVVNNKEDTDVVVTLGSPAVMRCYAIGFPVPAINWFRGSTVLPISDTEFEQKRDNSLYIRAVSLTNLGIYTCQVYNGQGRPASHIFKLKAFGPITGNDPNDLTSNEFLVPSSDVSSFDTNFRPPPPYQPVPEPQPQPVEPLRFGVNSSAHHIKAGSNLTLTCNLLNQNTEEPIDVMFTWHKNEVPLAPIEGRVIPQGNQLIIVNADEEDSGNYTCLYDYNGQEGLTDAVPIVVQRTLLHPECKDHKALANCSLIVMHKYCVHKYYAKFCCKSCTEAGQLPVHYPGAQPPWQNLQPHNRRPRSSGQMLPSRRTPLNAPDHETDFKVRFKNPIVEKISLH